MNVFFLLLCVNFAPTSMTLSRIINAASGVLGGMSKTPSSSSSPVNTGTQFVMGDGGAADASSSPADEVDRLFHNYMGGQHYPAVHHYPQNPYTSPDYYGGGESSSVYYPSQYGL